MENAIANTDATVIVNRTARPELRASTPADSNTSGGTSCM